MIRASSWAQDTEDAAEHPSAEELSSSQHPPSTSPGPSWNDLPRADLCPHCTGSMRTALMYGLGSDRAPQASNSFLTILTSRWHSHLPPWAAAVPRGKHCCPQTTGAKPETKYHRMLYHSGRLASLKKIGGKKKNVQDTIWRGTFLYQIAPKSAKATWFHFVKQGGYKIFL